MIGTSILETIRVSTNRRRLAVRIGRHLAVYTKHSDGSISEAAIHGAGGPGSVGEQEARAVAARFRGNFYQELVASFERELVEPA